MIDPARDTSECLNKKLEHDPSSIIVASDSNSRIVGTVFTVSDGWACFIFRLAVHPEYRTKIDSNTKLTVGMLLMKEAESRLSKHGAKDVGIIVNDDHMPLKLWYEKQGYRQTGIYRFMWKDLK